VLSEVPYGVHKLIDVARVLCSESSWALPDEPMPGTTSEDRPAISAAPDLLAEHGTTVIVVDHDVDFVARYARSLVALDQGEVIAWGDTLGARGPVVRRIYFGLVRENQVEAAQQHTGVAAAEPATAGGPPDAVSERDASGPSLVRCRRPGSQATSPAAERALHEKCHDSTSSRPVPSQEGSRTLVTVRGAAWLERSPTRGGAGPSSV
jgi:energy-coupling factor transporter ATP-binding protein EcfA2